MIHDNPLQTKPPKGNTLSKIPSDKINNTFKKNYIQFRIQTSRSTNASTNISREVSQSRSIRNPYVKVTENDTPVHSKTNEGSTILKTPERSISLGNGIKHQLGQASGTLPYNSLRQKSTQNTRRPYFPVLQNYGPPATWTSVKIPNTEPVGNKMEGNIGEALRRKLEAWRISQEQKYKAESNEASKVEELMSRCDKLSKEVMRIDRVINNSRITYRKKVKNIKKQCASTGRVHDFWKNNSDFLEKRAKMNSEVSDFKKKIQQEKEEIIRKKTDAELFDVELSPHNLSFNEEEQNDNEISKILLKEPKILVPRIKPLSKFALIELRAQSVSSRESKEDAQTERTLSLEVNEKGARGFATDRVKYNEDRSPRKKRIQLKQIKRSKLAQKQEQIVNTNPNNNIDFRKNKFHEEKYKEKGTDVILVKDLQHQNRPVSKKVNKTDEEKLSVALGYLQQQQIKLGYKSNSSSSRRQIINPYKKISL